jgi:hypothetical protein
MTLAAVTRRGFPEQYAEADTLCCFAHTPAPGAGFAGGWAPGLAAQGFEWLTAP